MTYYFQQYSRRAEILYHDSHESIEKVLVLLYRSH